MRITHISDTHNRHKEITADLLGGDILIHSGDFSLIGERREVEDFLNWFKGIKSYKYKVFIAGNHDLIFDSEVLYEMAHKRDFFQHYKSKEHFLGEINRRKKICGEKPAWLKELLGECLENSVFYLEDSFCVIDGIKIWGSPYSPEFSLGWAFNLKRGETAANHWEKIPDDTDIIITHGPMYGILDQNYDNISVGCEELLKRIQNINPHLHFCGHIHEAYGYKVVGKTHSFNGCSVALNYRYKNKPISFDYNFQTRQLT